MQLKPAEAARFLRKPDPSARAFMAFGPDRARVEDAAGVLTRFALGADPDPLNLTRLGEDDLRRDKARLADEVMAQSLLGGARVVRLRIEGDTHADQILPLLAEIGDGAPMGAVLVIEGGDLKGGSKIRKAFEDTRHCVSMVFYEESAEELGAFAQSLIAEAGLEFEPAAREAFVAALPDDRGGIRGEIEKMATFAHGLGRALDEADVRALSVAASESELDEAAMAALAGRGDVAARTLDRVGATNGVTLLKALERKLLRLAEAQVLVAQGVSRTEAGGKLRPPVFWKERDAFAQQLGVWSAARVQAGLARLWAAEVACKAAGAPSVLIAAQCFAEIARLASSARR
ncbi:MAG: DNA polymerase III subunit delta [Alphaproteobacteria bacterium]|nr:DNA polymerase III subunit delta [Alphaproteobacteria bacterium]